MEVNSILREGTPKVDFKEMATPQQQDPHILKLQTFPIITNSQVIPYFSVWW